MPSVRSPALLLLLTIACSTGNPPGTADPASQTQLRVDNRASLDMDIYAVRGDGQSIRLGFAPGGEATVFALPPTVTAGATSLRFEARPVRSSGAPVVSEPFGVRKGDVITWSVPPQ